MQHHTDIDASLVALDRALTGAVTAAAASVVRVARRRGAGSGLAWTDELVVTSSFHTPDEPTVAIADGDDVVERPARVLGRDPGTDVALLAVDGGGLAPIAQRELDGVAAGQLAFALARPGRAIRASMRALGVLGPTVRTPAGGRVDRYLETDRALPRGFAGGPLVDLAGRALGMNTRTLFPGVDLCVPITTLARVVEGLRAHGRIARGYLGVGVQPAAIPAAVSDGRGRGALVVSLDDDGPAARAGVLVGDVVIAIDGAPVTGPDDLRLAVFDRPDAEVAIDLVRGGVRAALTATVGARP
ncbi:MAG: PDZ domain-containing protein [Myxococcales bacterium]|nr:PDZ domain-containing protein [Myxococcales bacterium]